MFLNNLCIFSSILYIGIEANMIPQMSLLVSLTDWPFLEYFSRLDPNIPNLVRYLTSLHSFQIREIKSPSPTGKKWTLLSYCHPRTATLLLIFGDTRDPLPLLHYLKA